MEGVIAAVPTAIDKAGRPQKEPFLEHCAWALANGCDGLNILGSTGEANSFAQEDRKSIMSWAAETLDQSRLMVGTGTPSLGETIALTRQAARLGYKTALVLPPYYYKPVTDAGLIDWYTALHEALGSDPIELYFYNFPQMTGLAIPVNVIAALARKFPSRFTGIKDSSGDLGYCRDILAQSPDLCVFPSSETSLVEAQKSGFAGCISATTNITSLLCADIWKNRASPDAKTAGELARQRTAIAGPTLIPAIKYLVGKRSGHDDWRLVLPPFQSLGETEIKELENKLSA
ncbi:MAG: dihydrodipicolinate synthase family protein [Stappiaceae bacterium]